VLIVHPGGPAWARRDAGVWSIPKGEYDETEDPLACALREFEEETGTALDPAGEPLELGAVKQRGGKIVTAWALEGDLDADSIRSNTFRMQWPPRSGQWATFPEVDRASWFGLAEAREKLNPAQVEFLDRLAERLRLG
jgi:predicted NUDIX family NTP pyrophosphohydrolase